jgi:hypothetical protein
MFKTRLNRYLALLAAGAAAVGGAELAARYMGFGEPPIVVLDDKIAYYLAPSRNYARFGHDIVVNRYGMRSDDFEIESAQRQLAFSMLGDSVVYGNLLDQADTPPAQLQKLLRAKGQGRKVLVNSIAASGWGPENLLQFYKRFGPFPGRTAWIVQNTGDMEDVIDSGKDVPYRTSSPYGALHDLALSSWRGMMLRILPGKADPAGYQDRRRRADIALHALITALKADYARVVLVFHAARDEALSGRSDGHMHYQVTAKEHAIDFISTMDWYARAYRSDVAPHYDDVHLNKDGARLLAERLAADVDPSSDK